MTKRKRQSQSGCLEKPLAKSMSCCAVEAVIPIDNRGQIVLPKEVREKAGMQAGDKIAVISCESNGEVCCVSLIKADQFAGAVKDVLGPIMKEVLAE